MAPIRCEKYSLKEKFWSKPRNFQLFTPDYFMLLYFDNVEGHECTLPDNAYGLTICLGTCGSDDMRKL